MSALELVTDGALIPAPTTPDEVAAAWLLGYSERTRVAYLADLRDWSAWLADIGIAPFAAKRVHVDAYARALEIGGRSSATVARRLAALSGFYSYAADEGLIDRSPVLRVRRPKPSPARAREGLDRAELGALIAAARQSSPRDYALACLLALNGLRVSEALGADAADLGHRRGHRTLSIERKGGACAIVPLAPITADAIDAYLEGREEGPLYVTGSGRRMDRHAALKVVRRLARTARISKRISPHSLRHAFVTAALDAGANERDVQDAAGHADPRMTRLYDRDRYSLDRHPTYAVAAFIS